MPDFEPAPDARLSPWDIVKVPFPYTNRPVLQRRPALVLATPPHGGGAALLWVLMITSAENRAWPGDVPIDHMKETGLPARSIIRTTKVATIDQASAEKLGTLPTGGPRSKIMTQVLGYLPETQ